MGGRLEVWWVHVEGDRDRDRDSVRYCRFVVGFCDERSLELTSITSMIRGTRDSQWPAPSWPLGKNWPCLHPKREGASLAA